MLYRQCVSARKLERMCYKGHILDLNRYLAPGWFFLFSFFPFFFLLTPVSINLTKEKVICFFHASMLAWLKSSWQSKWQDDSLEKKWKGTERFLWTASYYLLFLCCIMILKLFTPWTLIGTAHADVQWRTIRIKNANKEKWGHVSKAAVFPWLLITATNAEISLLLTAKHAIFFVL